ncbi:hypothetical protein WICMUC_002512 [Wickerhamomyces mucosus]|uniref:Vacuolar membrane protease n=1 Tax=Wickerhamomyces mucosus TaxID=1378264 RepID=A0A9P8PQI0_9ASCO|nr:hypothetical protein WICMUC_002512 [Wickerhamomyces mucosus]
MAQHKCSERYKFNWKDPEKLKPTSIRPIDKSILEKVNSYSNMSDLEKHGADVPIIEPSNGTLIKRIKKIVHFTLISVTIFISFYNSSIFSTKKDDNSFSLEELTTAYKNVLKSSNLAGNWSKIYTAEPHLAGTNYGLVQFTKDKFEEYGFTSSVDTFDTYINYPKSYSLSLIENGEIIYKPTLVEDILEEDPTTSGDDLIPAFHGYSANGNATAEYVYINYGTVEDFKLLAANNVSIEGKIAIARYGDIFRGLKVKHAQEAGAIGVLIYSDPADDYIPSDVAPYPAGPGRNPSSIQRGSVQFLSSSPGDPSRFTDRSPEALANLTAIPKIPSLPISFKEVKPILLKLNGHGKNLGFKGGIEGFDYSLGPAPGYEINLFNDNEYKIADLWNVLGYVEGHEKDNLIIIGNHRDAWIKGGASDPNSGSAALLEVARSFNELFKNGYKPRYSILLASWDGEEYALLGSTNYAESYAEKLQKELVAYINVDVAVGGTNFKLSSSPLINDVLLDVADLVVYPKAGNITLKEHFLNTSKISILGSGSDYTSFYEHLGITSVDLGFNLGKGDPVYHYHSNYDSYHWVSTFADPGFKFHNAAAQYIGLLTLTLSETKTLINFKSETYSSAINGYFDELAEKIPKGWLDEKIELDSSSISNCEANHHHDDFTLEDLVNKTKKSLNHLVGVSHKFDKRAAKIQTTWEEEISSSSNPFKKIIFNYKIKKINNKLKHLEKNFLHEEGLNGREWFKHIGFASGRYTGYAGQTLPGLTEALEDLDFEQTVKWISIIRNATKKTLISLVK